MRGDPVGVGIRGDAVGVGMWLFTLVDTTLLVVEGMHTGR
jgi:hypothetical protein